MDVVLEARALRKQFGDVCAVDGINLTVQRGEVYGFLGPNGAGKTTTIGMVLGLIYPTAGELRVFGQPITPNHTQPLRRVGALVGATASITPYLTARQNLQCVARLHAGCDEARIEETLAQVGLVEAADRKAGHFSTGMKQRLGLAMALIHQPELLILDEPTNGMDPAGMLEVRNRLRELADDGMTIFLSSHLLHEVEQICDRVAVLDSGKVVAEGRVTELLGGGVTVKVRVPDTRAAAACLAQLPGVERVDPNGAYVLVSGRESGAIVEHLARHGIIPTEVASGQRDLEQLFLQLTA
jgi:ABC-2 type transport system ATP-binding protein